MIYFGATEQFIKLGYSSEQRFLNRLKEHQRNWGRFGWTVLAVMHGELETEAKLKAHFRPYKDADNSEEQFIRGCPLEGYIEALVDKGYACTDPRDINECPELPFEAISPDRLRLNAVDETGQLSLLSYLPIEERVAIRSRDAQNHSFSDEWYTPEEWIERARLAMGSIDTDPSTSSHVNSKFIRAKTFYTKQTNGLDYSRVWHGNVWLNPPYGRGDNSAGSFIERLAKELDAGTIRQAVTCLNLASMSSLWFTRYIPTRASAHCIAHGRPNFIPPDDKANDSSPTKGTVFSYFGHRRQCFIEAFQEHGQILIPMQAENADLVGAGSLQGRQQE